MVYNWKEKVDSKFNDIAEILPGKENVHIKERVIRLWKNPAFLNPGESSSIEMVLVDEKVSDCYNSVSFFFYCIDKSIYFQL
jgi:hypothetical protein